MTPRPPISGPILKHLTSLLASSGPSALTPSLLSQLSPHLSIPTMFTEHPNSTPAPPGPVVRHLTTLLHPSGVSVFAPTRIAHLTPKLPKPQGVSPGQFGNLYITDRPRPDVMSADLSETVDGVKCLVAPNGANFRVTDIAPRTKGNMHATDSVDFLIVHKGQVTLHLDSGEKRKIEEGDVIVQRGTVHAWENETDEWTRMYVVLLHADRPFGAAHQAGLAPGHPGSHA